MEDTIIEICNTPADIAYPTKEQLEAVSQELIEKNLEAYKKLGSEE